MYLLVVTFHYFPRGWNITEVTAEHYGQISILYLSWILVLYSTLYFYCSWLLLKDLMSDLAKVKSLYGGGGGSSRTAPLAPQWVFALYPACLASPHSAFQYNLWGSVGASVVWFHHHVSCCSRINQTSPQINRAVREWSVSNGAAHIQ